MESLIAGTFLAYDHTLFCGAIVASGNTLSTGTALLAPSLNLEITFSAIGTVTLALLGAVYTQKSLSEI